VIDKYFYLPSNLLLILLARNPTPKRVALWWH